MSSVYELHLRSSSLHVRVRPRSRPVSDTLRPGETSGERRIRLLRTVLGERDARGEGPDD
jgi:hypothetical protein